MTLRGQSEFQKDHVINRILTASSAQGPESKMAEKPQQP